MTFIVDSIISSINKIIDKIFPDAETREKAKLELGNIESYREIKELESRLTLLAVELNSSDKFISRARPTFMYVFYLIILAGIPIGALGVYDQSLATIFCNSVKSWLSTMPHEFWVTFDIGYTGYIIGRSYDKRARSRSLISQL